MIRFECDYAEGAHPKILELLNATNFDQTPVYGADDYCLRAAERIKELCDRKDAEVHFLVGGTQTNMTVISSVLRPHQGVISPVTGHINIHETGAIEATGHKVLAIGTPDGKLTAEQIREYYDAHWNDEDHEHIVQPGMVYISHPTETGTTYSKAELQAISGTCREIGLPLFLDGARLGYGIMADGSDLSLPDIARLCDVFYIGGTKVGALFGEAVVITNNALKKDFRYLIKQRGGMLAKGRLLGIQFFVLLERELYFEISHHAVRLAMMIREAFKEKGCAFLYDSHTNQQFPILPKDKLAELSKKYAFAFWKDIDEGSSAIRVCTSWATKEEDVRELISDIRKII